jgi:thioredoxin-like negative regulator of GroEL
MYLEGLALTALGRYDEASRRLSQAARRERPSPEVLCALAEAELLSGDIARAQRSVHEALTLDPNHAASRALSARLAVAPRAADATMR